jgi:DDE superfamily endonuclease
MINGRPPRCERMTGLDQEQVDWLVVQVGSMIRWDAPTGRPRVLSLSTAVVVVLFGLRHNLAAGVIGELFGCAETTVEHYQDELEIVIDVVLTPLYEQICAQAHRGPVLVDGFVVPVGERDNTTNLYSGKKHINGQNVQVVGTLSGRFADVGEPCPGSMYDSRAFVESGLAQRWANHLKTDVPQMIGDKGYQGAGVLHPMKKPRGRALSHVQQWCNTGINQIRAAVERLIAHLKCWKVLKTGFRRSLHEFPQVLRTVTKLEVFRVYGLH